MGYEIDPRDIVKTIEIEGETLFFTKNIKIPQFFRPTKSINDWVTYPIYRFTDKSSFIDKKL